MGLSFEFFTGLLVVIKVFLAFAVLTLSDCCDVVSLLLSHVNAGLLSTENRKMYFTPSYDQATGYSGLGNSASVITRWPYRSSVDEWRSLAMTHSLSCRGSPHFLPVATLDGQKFMEVQSNFGGVE